MRHIFIGYLLVFFHIKINGIDLLPDFVGYALIAAGLGKLSEKSHNFVKAMSWAYIMAAYLCLVFIGQLVGMSFNGPIFTILNLIAVAVRLYILYLIDTGIYEIEQSENINIGAEKLMKVWKAQAVLQVAYTVLSFVQEGIVLLIMVILAVGSIIANIAFLVDFYNTKKVYEGI